MSEATRSSLKVGLRPGEGLEIGDVIVQLIQKSGQVARLRIVAPRDVKIQRRSLDDLDPRMAESSLG